MVANIQIKIEGEQYAICNHYLSVCNVFNWKVNI